MTKRLLKSLRAAHAGNAAIHLMKDEENLVVEPRNSNWRVFLGFDGFVQIMRGDDAVEEFEAIEGNAEAMEWYRDQLLYRPEEYAQELLDRSGLAGEFADAEKPD